MSVFILCQLGLTLYFELLCTWLGRTVKKTDTAMGALNWLRKDLAFTCITVKYIRADGLSQNKISLNDVVSLFNKLKLQR